MPKVVKYANVINNATINGGGGSATSLKIPTFGARSVILVARAASGAFALGSIVTLVFGVIQTDAGFGSTGITLTDGIGGKIIAGNGAAAMWSASAGTYIMWPFMSLGINGNVTGGNNVVGVTVDAYVLYEGDRDKLDLGQDAAVPA